MKRIYSITFTIDTDVPIGPTIKRKLQNVILSSISKYFFNFFRTPVKFLQVEEIKEVVDVA